MPDSSRSEVYFIIAMMVVIVVLCGIAMIAFFRTYRKEMRKKEEGQSQTRSGSRSTD